LASEANCARLEGICQQESDEENDEKSNDESAINILSQWKANAGWHDAPQSDAGLSGTVQVVEQFPGVLSAATPLRAGSTAKRSRQQTKIS
jgi:hypothetical protein